MIKAGLWGLVVVLALLGALSAFRSLENSVRANAAHERQVRQQTLENIMNGKK